MGKVVSMICINDYKIHHQSALVYGPTTTATAFVFIYVFHIYKALVNKSKTVSTL